MNEFFLVMRCFIKNGSESHSVEMKSAYAEAQKRFYSVIDADINNDQIEYLSAYVISSAGTVYDWKVVDRRVANVEE